MQAQDLVAALDNGWVRYADVMRRAELAGLLRPGTYDPTAKQWALQDLPALAGDGSEAAAIATAEAPELSGAEEASATASPEPAELPDAKPVDTQGALAPLPALQPLPQVVVPKIEDVDGSAAAPEPTAADAIAAEAAPAQVEPAPDEVATADMNTAQPEPETVTTATAAAADPSHAAGSDWVVSLADGRASASVKNRNVETAEQISALHITCNPNGTLRYTIYATGENDEYLVFMDDKNSATILAVTNIISGNEALRMSYTLRFAYEWAMKDQPERAIVVSAKKSGVRAEFPATGFLEARGKVLDTCEPWDDGTAEVQPGGAESTGNAADESAPSAESSPAEAAPIPHIRPKRLAG
jgi:hypothetical protein